MKKLISCLLVSLAALLSVPAHAAGEGIAWDKAPALTNDLPALQSGAKLFVNYCLNCHSAAFMRYNRLRDIGLTEQQIKDNLLFTTDKVGETMKAAIDPRQAKEWFGANPPDLTLIARSRSSHGGTGADYLYTFLRTFYPDPTKATGWNNLAFPSVGPGVPGVEAGQPRHHDARAVRPGGGQPRRLPAVDGRADPEHPGAGGRLGAAVPAGFHVDRVAAQRRLLEGRAVSARPTDLDCPRTRSGAPPDRVFTFVQRSPSP
jgi:hypothetical protein